MKKRLLAVGDIHGCLRAFDTLLDAINVSTNDTLITLGDYVDRGLNSPGVLNRMIHLNSTLNLVALRGNHETLMMEARNSPEHLRLWVNCGGDSTLCGYSQSGYSQALKRVPREHWDFLDHTCVDWFETDMHFFVHAGVNPNVVLAKQDRTDLHWRRFDNPPPHVSNKTMVCGHTPQKTGQPRSLGHAICIDTEAHDGGWLTCLEVLSGTYWQSNEAGKVQRGALLQNNETST